MHRGRRTAGLIGAAALVLVADLVVLADHHGDRLRQRSQLALLDAEERAASIAALPADLRPEPTTTTSTTAPPPPPTTTTLPPTTTTTLPPARPGSWTIGPYQGVGVWLDVYDWTNEITGGRPSFDVSHVDHMADLGIQTLFIQTSHRRSASDVMEPERLLPIIDRAHARGLAVVAWYLPMLEDTNLDLRRLVAASQLPVDGLGVDIESLAIADPADRNRRLLELSTALRGAVGTKAISAITQSPVVMQVVNQSYWPAFPWPEIGTLYDVVVPMSYWSERKPELRNGALITGEDIDRIRASTGRPDIPIHVAGGIANGITMEDLAGMVGAIQQRSVLGGSLYDWNTSQAPQWDLLRALRVG